METTSCKNSFSYEQGTGYLIEEDLSPKRIERLIEEKTRERQIAKEKKEIIIHQKELDSRRKYVIMLEAKEKKERRKEEKLNEIRLSKEREKEDMFNEIRQRSIQMAINSDKNKGR